MPPSERFLEWYGLTSDRLIRSKSWWRNAVGFTMALVAFGCIGVLLVTWLLLGKKPR